MVSKKVFFVNRAWCDTYIPLIFVCQLMCINGWHRKYWKYLAREALWWIFARDAPEMGYQPGVKLWFRLLHICKNYHINVDDLLNRKCKIIDDFCRYKRVGVWHNARKYSDRRFTDTYPYFTRFVVIMGLYEIVLMIQTFGIVLCKRA